MKSNNEVNQLLRSINENIFQLRCASNTTPTTEFDHVLLCDPVSGNLVIAVTTYSGTGAPTTTYYNQDGTPYVGGTPIRCADSFLESDIVEGCAAGITYMQHVVKNNGQPTGQVYYTDTTGALVPTPIGFTIGRCNLDPISDSICLCDDNAGVFTEFVRFYTYDPNANTVTFTGDWLPDLSAPYTPTGTVGLCSQMGTPLQLVQRRVHLTGIQTWVRPASVVSMTVFVRRIGDVTNPASVTDNAGGITPLFIQDNITYGVPNDNATVLQGTFSINMMHVDDVITIQYLELV